MASRARNPSQASSSSREAASTRLARSDAGRCFSYIADVDGVEDAAQFPVEAGSECFDAGDVSVIDPVRTTCVCDFANHRERERKPFEDEGAKTRGKTGGLTDGSAHLGNMVTRRPEGLRLPLPAYRLPTGTIHCS